MVEIKEWRRQEGNGWCCCWDCVETNERMIEAVSEGVSGENVACYVWGGLVYKMLFFSACFLSLFSIGFADPKAWPWNDPEPPAAARLRSSRCVSV